MLVKIRSTSTVASDAGSPVSGSTTVTSRCSCPAFSTIVGNNRPAPNTAATATRRAMIWVTRSLLMGLRE